MREELLSCLKNIKGNPAVFVDEASTKQCVILRILRVLGWDIDNPEEVKPEYTVENRRVDYSLRLKNENKVFLEVKKTGEDLDKEKYEEQLLEYSFRQGVGLAILTNGMTWWLYLPTQKGDWKKRRFYTIDIMEQEIESVAENFIKLLAKNNIDNGLSLQNAEAIFKGKLMKESLEKALPEAWIKLVGEFDQRLLDLLADTTEKLCGYKPDAEYLKKFLASIADNSLKWEEQQLPKIRGSSHLYQTVKGEGILVCEGKRAGVHALGRQSSDGFWVLKGSTAISSETKTIPPSAKKNRDNLRKEGILMLVGNFYEFTSDYRFRSSSAAAGVVLARSANGKIEWKKTGK